MAIAYSTGGSAFNVSATATNTFTFDAGTGTDRLLVVQVTHEINTGPATLSNVAYNGTSMTLAVASTSLTGQFNEHCSLYYLVAPTTGSNDFTVDISQTGQDIGIAWAVYTGVDQTTPIENAEVEFTSSFMDGGDGDRDITTTTNDATILLTMWIGRSNTGPFTVVDGNSNLRVNYSTATGNSGYSACLVDRATTTAGAYLDTGAQPAGSQPGGILRLDILPVAAATSDIVAGDISFAFSVDAPTLTSIDTLSVNDLSLAFDLDNVALTEISSLSVNELLFNFLVDVPSLVTDDSLSLEDIAFVFSVDNLSLTASQSLVVNDLSFVFSLDEVTLASSVIGTLTVPALTNNTGSVEASVSSILYWVYDATRANLIASGIDGATNGSGNLVLASADFVVGTNYWVYYHENLADTGKRGSRRLTAT